MALKTLVVGCGNMGGSHARAYYGNSGFELVGVVDRSPEARAKLCAEIGDPPQFDDYESALAETKPDVVCIATYPETHADFCENALRAGCHVFVEKPLAPTVEQAERVVQVAQAANRKVVVGYILRVHPAWKRFIEISRGLGKPLVMRMNLNQQSSGKEWGVHKNLMNSMSPIVDCGVHYVDVMCQMTGAKPVRVHAIGARLTEELNPGMYNYGHLHVAFDDGSVGWYEAGWGPMMSETAFFVKDVVGPKGCVSMVSPGDAGGSADIDSHTKTNKLRVHSSATDDEGDFTAQDSIEDMSDEPDHQELCNREQAFLLNAIKEDVDLSDHLADAVNSLRIVLAADESHRTGQVVRIG